MLLLYRPKAGTARGLRLPVRSLCTALSLAAVLLGSCGGGEASRASDPTAPNVLFILADDLGWRDLSSGEPRLYLTPHIDRLAQRGLRFDQAYAASPLCSPTRASIMTGQDPARHGVTAPMGHLPEHRLKASLPQESWPDRRVLTPSTATRIALEHETLAEAFRAAGYRTALFGKWHLGGGAHHPTAHGFDSVLGGGPHPGPPSYFAPFGIEGLPPAEEGRYLTDVLVEGAIEWLERDRIQPFFACLWFYTVHAPFQARGDLRQGALERLDPQAPQRSATYAAMLRSMDDGVGRVMTALEDLGLGENTIVVFTSDNGGNQYDTIYGDLPGAEGVGIAPTSNAPLRGGKGTIWEGGVRVPLIIVWPQGMRAGRVQPGARTSALATSTDLYPTLLELAGLPPRPEQALDGVSLVPALEGRGEPRQEVPVHFPHDFPIAGNRPATSLRVGSHKLVRLWADGASGADRELLFDLSVDPSERVDLAAREPEIRARLGARMDAYLRRAGTLLPRANPGFDPHTERWFTGPGTGLEVVVEGDRVLLQVTSEGVAPSLAAPLGGGIGGHLELQLDLATDAPGPLTLFLLPESDPTPRSSRRVSVPIEADGAWHSLRITLEAGGPLAGLRLDPLGGPGQVRLADLKLFNVGGDLVREWRPIPSD